MIGLKDTQRFSRTHRGRNWAGVRACPAGVRLKVSYKIWFVAQICNLPYRRFAIGRLSYDLISFVLAEVQQNKILRYSRLENLRYFLQDDQHF